LKADHKIKYNNQAEGKYLILLYYNNYI